jgi:hypothetical protein
MINKDKDIFLIDIDSISFVVREDCAMTPVYSPSNNFIKFIYLMIQNLWKKFSIFNSIIH